MGREGRYRERLGKQGLFILAQNHELANGTASVRLKLPLAMLPSPATGEQQELGLYRC